MKRVFLFNDLSESSLTIETREGVLWLILKDKWGLVEYAVINVLQVEALIHILNNLLDGDYQSFNICAVLCTYPMTVSIEIRQNGRYHGTMILSDCTKGTQYVGPRIEDFSHETFGELRGELKKHLATMAVQ